jgi:hypothetical protein
MPTPIIELQRRLTLVGALRAGGERPPDGRRPGAKLEAFRLTSPKRTLIEQAAQLYGGDVTAWRSPVGEEWQVYTQADEIPVLVMPGYSVRQSYELWEGATKRTRLCDGVDEELSGGACICASEGIDACDLYTRLVVALPELDTVLGWRLITKGANAGHELPTMLNLVEAMSGGRTFVPGRMRIDQRRGVKDGQVVRYVVPVLDLGVGYARLAAGAEQPALLAGADTFTPIPKPAGNGGAMQALDSVIGPTAPPPIGGRAAPMPDPGVVEHAPMSEAPNEDAVAPTSPASDTTVASAGQQIGQQTYRRSDDQAKKLNVLVGQLRDGGHITTAQLYDAIAGLRSTGGEDLVLTLGGYDAEGQLHWSPLRDALTRPEASQLIDWLTTKEAKVKEATA